MSIDPTSLSSVSEMGKSLAPKVYEDGLRPSVVEVGRTLGGVVRTALRPINGLVWSVDQAVEWLEDAAIKLLEKRKTPPEQIITPRPQILDGVIRGVRAAGPEPDPALRDLYASLFATAMDGRTAPTAHPAFADILQQIVSDEARIIRLLSENSGRVVVSVVIADGIPFEDIDEPLLFTETLGIEAGCHYPELVPSYIDNLKRLGIVEDSEESIIAKNRKSLMRELFDSRLPESRSDQRAEAEARDWLEQYPDEQVRAAVVRFDELARNRDSAPHDSQLELTADALFLTSFGEQFVRACIGGDDRSEENPADDEVNDADLSTNT
jgi:hypothetical protein